MASPSAKSIIVCDLDGCLVDFNDGFAKLLRKINPSVKVDTLAPTFPPVWEWPQHYGYGELDIKKAWIEAENSGSFWSTLHPYTTAYADLDCLNGLRSRHDIYFVTNRPGPTAKQESEAWLGLHGYTGATVVVSGRKGEFCEAVGASLIIDDMPGNLLTQWSEVQKALFKRPYNKTYWNYFTKTVETVREALDGVI